MNDKTHDRVIPTVRIGGFDTARVTRTELAELMVADCHAAREQAAAWTPKLVFSSNGQGIALAGKDDTFLTTMNEADVIHADGMPVVLASRATKRSLPDRIATTDFFHDAARAAEREGLRFFFLGASEPQNAAAVARVREMYPKLEVAGRHHGYFDSDETQAVLQQIVDARTDVLWVALGKPRQERWCVEFRDALAGVGWMKTCGGLYAFLAGDAPRAPRWMQAVGLEWLYRALGDPRRLLWRYLTTNPYAFWRILRHTDWRQSDGELPQAGRKN